MKLGLKSSQRPKVSVRLGTASGFAALVAPVNTAPPTITGTPFPGETLTVTPGAWTGAPDPVVTRVWRINGVAISGPAETGLTYVVRDIDLTNSNVIDVLETATNPAGSVTADSNDLTANISYLFRGNEVGYAYDNRDFNSPNLWRTNGALWTEDWANAIWSKTNMTVTAASRLAPDGTLTATKLTPTATAATIVNQPGIIARSSTVTFSIYVHSTDATATSTTYLLRNQTTTTNFDTCVFTHATGAITGTGWTATAVGGGWYRLEYTRSSGVTWGNELIIYAGATGASRTAGEYWHVWGAQLNSGATAAYQKITDFNTEYLAAFPNTSLFADVSNTVAVMNGPVGLQLDKSRGQTAGADARANGAVGLVGAATAATWNAGTGVGTVTFVDGSNQSFVQFTGLTANTLYKFTFTAATLSPTLRSGTQAGTAFGSASGAGVFYCMSSASGVITITKGSAGTSTFTISDVHSIAGLHRYQLTAASRGTLRGTPTGANLVLNGDFATGTLANWTKPDTAPGTTTVVANKAVLNNNTTGTARLRQSVAVTIGRYYRLRFTASGLTGATNAASVALGNSGSGDSAYGIVTVPANGVYERWVGPMTTTILGIAAIVVTGVGACSVELDDFDCKDVTFDSVTYPYSIQMDGIDDGMLTATADFTATDAVSICMGMRKLSDAAAGTLVEFGVNSGSTNGTFGILAPNSAAANIRFSTRGTASSDNVYSNASVAAPVTSIVTAVGDISADANIIRKDGVQVSTLATDQGTGNYTSQIFYFGRRAGTAVPLNGMDRGGICIGRALTAAELSAVEAFVTNRTTGA
jgi:hypothetical protein